MGKGRGSRSRRAAIGSFALAARSCAPQSVSSTVRLLTGRGAWGDGRLAPDGSGWGVLNQLGGPTHAHSVWPAQRRGCCPVGASGRWSIQHLTLAAHRPGRGDRVPATPPYPDDTRIRSSDRAAALTDSLASAAPSTARALPPAIPGPFLSKRHPQSITGSTQPWTQPRPPSAEPPLPPVASPALAIPVPKTPMPLSTLTPTPP